MQSPFELLLHLLFTEPLDSTNYILSAAILANLKKANELTTQMLADSCNVSKPTVVRFCRHLGYKDFTQFKIALQQTPHRPLNLYPIVNNYEAFTTQYFQTLREGIMWMEKELPRKELMTLAAEIVRRENIYLFGNAQSNSSACDFSRRLILQGKWPYVVSSPLRQMETIQNMEKNALAIVISVYGGFWTSYVNPDCFAHKPAGQKVYWMTCNPNISDLPGVDHVIHCSPYNDYRGGNLAIAVALNLLLQYCWQLQGK